MTKVGWYTIGTSTTLESNKSQREKGQPWHLLAIEAGKEPIQAIGVFARFRGDDLITHQQIDILGAVDMLTEEHPKQDGPGEARSKKALDGAVTAAFTGPAGEAQHGDP